MQETVPSSYYMNYKICEFSEYDAENKSEYIGYIYFYALEYKYKC